MWKNIYLKLNQVLRFSNDQVLPVEALSCMLLSLNLSVKAKLQLVH